MDSRRSVWTWNYTKDGIKTNVDNSDLSLLPPIPKTYKFCSPMPKILRFQNAMCIIIYLLQKKVCINNLIVFVFAFCAVFIVLIDVMIGE